jgi:hypothetical protein
MSGKRKPTDVPKGTTYQATAGHCCALADEPDRFRAHTLFH